MSKRFIDISTLPKAWRKLSPSLKLTWYYIWNNCDASGVWEIDEDLFEFENGFKLDISSLTQALKNFIQASEEKILLLDFIKVNYSQLKENYNPHKPVFRAIDKNNLKLDPSLTQALFKLEDEDEDEDKEETFGKSENLLTEKIKKIEVEFEEVKYPFFSKKFKTEWDLYKAYRKNHHMFKFQDAESESRKLIELQSLSENDEEIAIKIIHQSIDNGWKGLFELKQSKTSKKVHSNR